MNKKIIIGGVIGVAAIGGWFFLGQQETDILDGEGQQKQDFLIETKPLADFKNEYFIKKSGTIRPESEITLTSQAPGRIEDIGVKEGDQVFKGQELVYLSDSKANLGIQVKQAQLALEKSQISYDSNKITLEKIVSDAELNLEKLQNNLEALKKNTNEDIKQAENTLENAQSSLGGDSKSSLELQKLDNTIEKYELDYENTRINNGETILGYEGTLKKDHNSLLLMMDDIIEFGDTLLGVTDANRNENNSFKTFLGAKDGTQKVESENFLITLIGYRNGVFSTMNFDNLTEEQIINQLDLLMEGYENAKSFLNSMEKTINNSVVNDGTLSSTQIATHLSTLNAYQSTHQTYYTAYISFHSSAKSFLRTYRNSEASLLKQIELLKKDRELLVKNLSIGELGATVGYEKTLIGTQDSINSLEIQLKTAESQLQNAIANKNITLQSLNNAIKTAELSLNIAQKEYAKLVIKAPINGFITEILTEVGHDVGVGNSILKIISKDKSQIEVALSGDEIGKISLGDSVQILYRDMTLTGSVYSKSSLADANLNYKVKVQLNDDIILIGDIVSVSFLLHSDKKLIPINLIRISQDKDGKKTGELYLMKDNEVGVENIVLGNVYGDFIEFDESFTGSVDIILSDMRNYNSEKFNLKMK